MCSIDGTAVSWCSVVAALAKYEVTYTRWCSIDGTFFTVICCWMCDVFFFFGFLDVGIVLCVACTVVPSVLRVKGSPGL